jgi:hypothetical protein
MIRYIMTEIRIIQKALYCSGRLMFKMSNIAMLDIRSMAPRNMLQNHVIFDLSGTECMFRYKKVNPPQTNKGPKAKAYFPANGRI